eukprot:CAMPEP_0184738482 /NCGR_PEP_ID=MMETSP0315-20130426/1098_1 /TAXON_ID=101924 /ORGANISM="Rhodosorus marinus, Strain UTEX LB 2760" /LENGTH=34 /DNA_ID= /DNA_START= /DNA_END= /DNA_ORIENTATION=
MIEVYACEIMISANENLHQSSISPKKSPKNNLKD